MSYPIRSESGDTISTSPSRFLYIIGAMKSGTTSLFEILAQHPAVCPSIVKEPNFFCDDQGSDARKNYMCLWDWRCDKHSYALEASVAYAKAPNVPGVPDRISRSGVRKNKFIYMLREPISRIESQVRHGLFAGWGKSLDEGMPDDAINFSRYAMQMDEYLEYFPMDDFLLVTLEEFKSDPDGVLIRVCNFLDIDNEFKFSDAGKARNTGEFFDSPTVVAKITQHPVGQFIAQKVLSDGIKTSLRNLISKTSRRSTAKASIGRFELTSEEKSIVIAQLAPDLRRLKEEFGVDVEKYWNHSV